MLQFVPYDYPQCDFFVTTELDGRLDQVFLPLGAEKIRRESYVAYIWHSRPRELFFLGTGVIDGKFHIGPQSLDIAPQDLGAGSYTILDFRSEVGTVTPDPFGVNLTYYSDTFVTNRLHLAALVVRTMNKSAAFSIFHSKTGFSFNFNTMETPVEGVKLLQTHSFLQIFNGTVSAINDPDFQQFETLDPADYWDLVEKGADEISRNVTAIVRSGLPAIADVTGGKDSRVVFGAIFASGLNNEVIFNTIANPTTPGLETDLRIATGLVKHYGGKYGGAPRVTGFSQTRVGDNLMRRRSQVFGSYHWITPSELRPISEIKKTMSIRMLGGGGELYRDNWRTIEFPWANPNEQPTAAAIKNLISRHRGKEFEELPESEELIVSTLMSLPGLTLGDKIDSHYLNLRCRLHFGARAVLPESMTAINLAMSPSLLKAYRGLPSRERSLGRTLYDVMSVFDEALPLFELEVPFSPDLTRSEYHHKNKLQGQVLNLDGAPELAKVPASIPSPVRPIRPANADWNFEQVVEDEIQKSRRLLSESELVQSDKFMAQLVSFENWSKGSSPANHSALASKLRFITDLAELSQA